MLRTNSQVMDVNMELMFLKCRIDYIIAPLKVLQSLEESVTDPDVKYSYAPRLTPAIGKTYNFTEEEVCGYCSKFRHLNRLIGKQLNDDQ